MEKQKAIELLEAQKAKLRKPGFTPDPWIDETSNYVAGIFGKESDQYRQINDLDFKEDYPKTGWKYRVQPVGYPIYNDIELAEQFIDGLIEYINMVGLSNKNKARGNSSDEIPSGVFLKPWVLAIICAIVLAVISGAFGLGYHFGIKKFDSEKEELFQESEYWKLEYNKLLESKKHEPARPDTVVVE